MGGHRTTHFNYAQRNWSLHQANPQGETITGR